MSTLKDKIVIDTRSQTLTLDGGTYDLRGSTITLKGGRTEFVLFSGEGEGREAAPKGPLFDLSGREYGRYTPESIAALEGRKRPSGGGSGVR